MKKLSEVKFQCPKGLTLLSGHQWKVTIISSPNYHRIYKCRNCGLEAEMKKDDFKTKGNNIIKKHKKRLQKYLDKIDSKLKVVNVEKDLVVTEKQTTRKGRV